VDPLWRDRTFAQHVDDELGVAVAVGEHAHAGSSGATGTSVRHKGMEGALMNRLTAVRRFDQ
jgi:hypothetical protein